MSTATIIQNASAATAVAVIAVFLFSSYLHLPVKHNLFQASQTFPISQSTLELMARDNLDGENLIKISLDLFMTFNKYKCS